MQEVPGRAGSNPVIEEWIRDHARNVKPSFIDLLGDHIAWCAVFVSMVLARLGIEGTNHGLARSYIAYGKPSRFVPGAIVVIQRKDRQSDGTVGRGGLHVGFFKKQTKHFIWIRGGNQRNQVSDQAFSKKNYDVLAIRLPIQTDV